MWKTLLKLNLRLIFTSLLFLPAVIFMPHFVFQRLVVSPRAFNMPDFYHFFPINIRLLAEASTATLVCVQLFYKSWRAK